MITDGACLGNPGPGGWACILKHNATSKELFGHARETTNNRMELTAAIEGLRALSEPCEVEVVTDSEYVLKGITEWIHGWKRRNWIKSDKKPVANADLWQTLDTQNSRHRTRWTWTRGHSSHDDNNRADELANRAAREQVASR